LFTTLSNMSLGIRKTCFGPQHMQPHEHVRVAAVIQ
jgi:hypothetical protein